MDDVMDFGQVTCPTKWSDVTLKKYQMIEDYYNSLSGGSEAFNLVDIVHILIDKDKDFINSLPIDFLNSIMDRMSFITEEPEVGKPTNSITIDGETYSANIAEKMKVGEYIAVDSIIKDSPNAYASILAVLCRKKDEIYDSKFENEVLPERIKMFEQQPITDILPIITFFLQCYAMSGTLTLLSSKAQEAINLTRSNIETLHRNGELSRRSMKSLTKKLKRYEKSIRCT